MKTKFFSVLAVAGAMFLASCGGGVSEETKKAVAAADSSMKAMMTEVDALSAEVTTALDGCNKCCSNSDSVAASIKPEWKGKCDSAMMDCKAAKTSFEDLANKINTAKSEWAADTTWSAFMTKVSSGKINDADAKKELDAFNAKGTAASASVTEWKAAMTAAGDQCKNGETAWNNFTTWCAENDKGGKKK
ncbi:MAG: hypothetical protein IT242_07725 [Bacteroidia bacterium]|nr:hypothetical protein [Bacteroidia bacterium]